MEETPANQPVEIPVQTQPSMPQSSNNLIRIMLVVFVVVLILIGATFAYLFVQRQKSTEQSMIPTVNHQKTPTPTVLPTRTITNLGFPK